MYSRIISVAVNILENYSFVIKFNFKECKDIFNTEILLVKE